MSKILLIGSRQNKFDSTDTGGVSILFELLISELEKREISFIPVDTLSANHGGKGKTLLYSLYQILKNIRKVDYISLHAIRNSYLTLGPIVVVLSKVFQKNLSLRIFAGDFEEKYLTSNSIQKFLMRFILKHSNSVFFELQYLVNNFKKYNKNTYWFPNVRDEKIKNHKNRTYQKRFVFIGSINPKKGIDELCEVIQKLDKDIICDIYGPIKSEKYSIKYFNDMGINYKGPLTSDSVLEVMNSYDVLILPSHIEGYPGVIIEAFALGMPVIATKLQGIMEMCTDNENALLIDVNEPQQLLKAIKSIDDKKYNHLHKGAIKAFSNFNSHIQTDLFLKRINYKEKNEKYR